MTAVPVPAVVGAGSRRHRVRRAWPGPDRVTLELVDRRGRLTAGWWAPGAGAVITEPGRDPDLPRLARLVQDGHRPIGHRLGRRAVVRAGDRYVKVLRAGRAGPVARRHRAVRDALAAGDGSFVIPDLMAVDPEAATLTFAAVPGAALLDAADPVAAGLRTGVALRRLATAPVAGLADHTVGDEIAVLDRWRSDCERFSTLPGPAAHRHAALVDRAVDGLLRLPPRPPGVVHRDLHDGQVLVDPDGGVTLLDLDTVVYGDPALDVGNLLAHLDLAVIDGRVAPDGARAVERAFLTGRAPRRSDRAAIDAYRWAARARLVAVHSFRPSTRRAARALLDASPPVTARP